MASTACWSPIPATFPGWWRRFEKYRPATYSGVNTLFDALLNSPEFARLDVSHLKLCVQGGTALRRATAEQWKAVTGKDVVEMYGLSETSAGITANQWDAPNPVGSIGMPLPGVETSLRDEEGREVALGELGELCVRGMQVTTGYWQRPDESETAFFPGGWFRTGDIAKADAQGYLYILDRLKDMILVSGFNVFPERDRGHRRPASGRAGSGGRGRARREMRRGGETGGGAQGPGTFRGGNPRALPKIAHRLQAAQARRVPRCPAEIGGGQSPEAGTAMMQTR